MNMLKANCPDCGAELELWFDWSEGPPDAVRIECDCGATPAWRVNWSVTLGELLEESEIEGRPS